MHLRKVQLGVLWYGDSRQHNANLQQFNFLKRILHDFSLQVYDCNKGKHKKLYDEFRKGKVDIVLKNSYGRRNEATLEAWLDFNKIPYLGSGANATFIGTSKDLSKILFKEYALPVAKDVFVDKLAWFADSRKLLRRVESNIGFPCIIKDIAGTDSRGIYLASSKIQFKHLVAKAVNAHRGVIVEQYIREAYEVTCLVAGTKHLKAYEPVGISSGSGFFSGKHKDQMSFTNDIPAVLSRNLREKIKAVSIHAHRALNCRDFSRADFMVKGNKLYLLEVDVHPGFREKSPTTLSVEYEGGSINELFFKLCKPYV